MKLTELSVDNFRGFQGAHSFQISDRFTVFAGINGQGKTSLLDGVALLVSRLLRSLALSDGNGRTIKPTDVHTGTESAYLAMRANCAGLPVDFRVDFRANSKTVRATPLVKTVREQIVRNYGDPDRADDQAPVAIYYTTDRAGLRLPRSLSSVLPQGQKLAHNGALVNRMVDYRDLMARYRLWASADGSREAKAFNEALSVFLHGFSDLRIEEGPLRMSVLKRDSRFSLSQLSDGERAFIAIIGDMVRRLSLANPELENPLHGYGIVLIDELELHLHPTWQREIVDSLRSTFPNIQFIATTHSPFVVQTLRDGELRLLDNRVLGDYASKGLEEVAAKAFVDEPNVVPRYAEMLEVAKEYFAKLEDVEGAEPAELELIKARLNDLVTPYSENPAYQAFLEMHRVAAFKGDEGHQASQ